MTEEQKKKELLRFLAYFYESAIDYAEDINGAGFVDNVSDGIELYKKYRING